jgi:CRISPR-associated protein Cmr2
VPAGFVPKTQVAEEVKKTFEEAAEKVWHKYLKNAEASGSGTHAIWNRQIQNFWEFAWVMGEDPGDGSDLLWLDARKNWRIPANTDPEGGDHCTVMHAWQELSGWTRSGDPGKQREFWKKIRGNVGKLDLRPDERLCAIAFVKRMLPKLAKEDGTVFGWMIDSRNWPSTAYMAAVPWIKKAWESDRAGAEKLTELAYKYFDEGARGERDTRIASLIGVGGKFRGLDGNSFHWPALANPNTTPLKDENGRKELLSALLSLQEKVGQSASPFYALLLMDGDGLGSMLHNHPETVISQSLAAFTHQVGEIVSQHDGVAVYAGGDDVLALLPLVSAIGAACRLELAFRDAFLARGIEATVSAAIIYSHFKQPLQAVLAEARHQLDDVAKDGNGRSSLAIAVLQGAGKNIEWVSTWCGNGDAPPLRVQASANRFKSEPQFSTRFFYGLGNLFGLLPGDIERAGSGFEMGLDEKQMHDWMVAEYLDNRERETSFEEAEQCVGELLGVCRRYRRIQNGFELQASGARLVKFLANPGKDI